MTMGIFTSSIKIRDTRPVFCCLPDTRYLKKSNLLHPRLHVVFGDKLKNQKIIFLILFVYIVALYNCQPNII